MFSFNKLMDHLWACANEQPCIDEHERAHFFGMGDRRERDRALNREKWLWRRRGKLRLSAQVRPSKEHVAGGTCDGPVIASRGSGLESFRPKPSQATAPSRTSERSR